MIKPRRVKWPGNAYRVLSGKLVEKRPLGRPRFRWADNIKMDLRVVGRGGLDWINISQGRDQWWTILNTVVILRVP
jgi:hypothetical protein